MLELKSSCSKVKWKKGGENPRIHEAETDRRKREKSTNRIDFTYVHPPNGSSLERFITRKQTRELERTKVTKVTGEKNFKNPEKKSRSIENKGPQTSMNVLCHL